MPKLLTIFIFLFLSACSVDETTQIITGTTMGTSYSIKINNNHGSKPVIDKRLDEIEQVFSTWDEASELSQLNEALINQWVEVSDELFFVLSQAKKIHRQTQGFFDPGMGRLIDIWGFGAVRVGVKPSRESIVQALAMSSIGYLRLNNSRVKKLKDMHINLSAIAKGYGVDVVANMLIKQGLKNFMVEIGGEVMAQSQWTIGIEKPNHGMPIAIELQNQAIATSGDYRNYLKWQGKKYQHILNPNTGLPVNTDLSSVSVIHNSAMMADAYATAMMAMGSQKAKILAQQLGLSVVLILNQQHDFKVLKIN
ncbi:thiamin biosynthesis lipoprotein ApbE [Abyssogena phaseoliformis symbiont OG214]|uniref:FAD:protein FMN transferase n=1 Tax=Abyssogena phaseoliformis symbiont TaxID=596095 RepID=UPI0019152820|nr:FAD:protein FMN transferase [Abyssogena phaseoliformis symbiont]MBW5288576.1 thiamine biosynthesis lipoprotein ApbE [Candidatus Ruthia sp. Apha_13_S6]BBB23277.1 thiamin biosynthesis lipoprotein ApbE [Abyssogena phaseoliformis symbiont OG214]